jgi:hypothetical protein
MDEISAYRLARGTQLPVALPTLPNGTVVVINPGGTQNNFVTEEFARSYIESYRKKNEDVAKHP